MEYMSNGIVLQADGGSMIINIVMIGLIFVIFYFLLIRPQQKRDKEVKKMLENLKRGDQVVTIGGEWGTIVNVKDKSVVLKVDDNCTIKYSRNAIAQIVTQSDDSDNASESKDNKENKESDK